MEKVKEFVKNHQKEIVIGTAIYFAYCVGHRAGWKRCYKTVMKAVGSLDNQGYRLVKVTSEVVK